MGEVLVRSIVKAPKSADLSAVEELARKEWKASALAYLSAYVNKAEPHDLFDLSRRCSLLRSAVLAVKKLSK